MPGRTAAGDRALELSGLAWTTLYPCHLSLRHTEWSGRPSPGRADNARFMAIAEAGWAAARRKARDEPAPSAPTIVAA
jgi:hypothetical protein